MKEAMKEDVHQWEQIFTGKKDNQHIVCCVLTHFLGFKSTVASHHHGRKHNNQHALQGFCLIHAVLLIFQSSSDDCDPHEGIHEGKEGKYRLQVTQFVQRLEYWQKELTNTLVTSITVATVHGRAVGYLGTADGRHIQVK